MKPFDTISFEKQYRIGGDYAAFAYLQDRLRELYVPEARGVQVKGFVLPPGWTIQDGVITPVTIQPAYALQCSGGYGAEGTSNAVIPLNGDLEYLDLHLMFRLDAPVSDDRILYRRANETNATRLAIEISITQEVLCRIGDDMYYAPWNLADVNYWVVGGWHVLQLNLNLAAGNLTFWLDGVSSGAMPIVTTSVPASTAEAVRLGADGVTIRKCILIANPLAMQWPRQDGTIAPHSLNHYDFTPSALTPTVIPDRALNPNYVDYRLDLTVAEDNGALIQL